MMPQATVIDGELHLNVGPIEVVITKSDGVDGALLVLIDTTTEPDGSDGEGGLRVLLNDEPIYNAVPYERYPDPDPNAARRDFFAYAPPKPNPWDSELVFLPRGSQQRITVSAVDHEHARRQAADVFGINHRLVTVMDKIEAQAFVDSPLPTRQPTT